jgi:hypothetical protein
MRDDNNNYIRGMRRELIRKLKMLMDEDPGERHNDMDIG